MAYLRRGPDAVDVEFAREHTVRALHTHRRALAVAAEARVVGQQLNRERRENHFAELMERELGGDE